LKFQRLSPNDQPDFTDQELVTIYLFGHMQGHTLKRRIHDRAADRYVRQHWAGWFPLLPSYQAFSRRLNGLTLAFQTLIGQCLPQAERPDEDLLRLVDSLPVMLSRGPHSPRARVARQQADLGYCAAKNQFYHGVKLHVSARRRPGQLPLPEWLFFTSASCHDLTAAREHLPLQASLVYCADKAYADRAQRQRAQALGSQWLTPYKAVRGEQTLPPGEGLWSRFVSAMRLPVESLFRWLMEQTGFQDAAKVRSETSLDLHCYGKLAVACFLLTANP
jgi:hypothetical protein